MCLVKVFGGITAFLNKPNQATELVQISGNNDGCM